MTWTIDQIAYDKLVSARDDVKYVLDNAQPYVEPADQIVLVDRVVAKGQYNPVTVPLPAHLAGDFLVATILVSSSGKSSSTPAGWTKLATSTTGTHLTIETFMCPADSVLTGAVSFPINYGLWIASIGAYRGVNMSAPVAAENTVTLSNSQSTSGNTISAIGFPEADGLELVAFAVCDYGNPGSLVIEDVNGFVTEAKETHNNNTNYYSLMICSKSPVTPDLVSANINYTVDHRCTKVLALV